MGALDYLQQRAWLGVKLGLEPIQQLLARLGHPERAAPALLVAGTNGKGSVVAVLDAALRAAGLRVGRYTSPHLQRVTERIAVDGRELAPEELEAAVGRVREAAESLLAAGALRDHPTYFEVLTAAGLVHFAARSLDVVLLEVGMGGRLDATNASAPLVSAVVGVGLDHERQLGNGLEAIAREKAGVMRRGRVTVRGPMPAAAARVLEACAAETGARLVDASAGASLERSAAGRVDLRTPLGHYPGLRPLPGAHQLDNLLVAVRVLEEAHAAGLAFPLERAAAGVSGVRWPGRLQEVPGAPALLLDGAHNPDGARALAAHLAGSPRFVLLFGAMADKDVESMSAALFPLARAVVLAGLAEPRAASPAELARRSGSAGARQAADVRQGLALARRLAGPGGRVVAAGSLYLVGEVLDLLEAERAQG
jgi:dihydrofolate synthase/folylpolyglutamate synthase